MTEKPSYGWKDLLVDASIIAVITGIGLVIVGTVPKFFGKFLPFLQ